MEPIESAAISACQAGNLKEFGVLYDRYVKKIYDFIYYKTWHRETAEDLTSQVFFKALEHIKSYDERKGNFSSWVYRIARNAVIDHYRTKKIETNIDDAWGLHDNTDIERDIDTAEKLAKVKTYLEQFKPQQREVVILRLWENMSYQEIADATGLSVANCKMTVSRVLSKLRQDMALAVFYIGLLMTHYLWQ